MCLSLNHELWENKTKQKKIMTGEKPTFSPPNITYCQLPSLGVQTEDGEEADPWNL